LIDRLTALLLSLDQTPAGAAALASIGATHFAAVDDQAYAAIH